MHQKQTIEISTRTIVIILLLLLLIRLIFMVKELIFSFLIAFIMMSALTPLVTMLQRKKIPRGLSAFIIFVLVLALIIYIFSAIIPPVIAETSSFFNNFPRILGNVNPGLAQYLKSDLFTQYIPNLTNNALVFFKNVFSNVIFVITTIVFSFYFIIEESAIKQFLNKLLGSREGFHIAHILERSEKRMRAWFWGETILMITIGILSFIGLTLMGIKYAITLAIIAGLLEVVPVLGPILAAIPAFIIAASQSYFLGISVLALYFIVQQVENHIIVPQVMKKTVGLNPIIILSALIIGGKLAGATGVLLAIPITLLIETILIETLREKASV